LKKYLSILVPSRNRPKNVIRLCDSLFSRSKFPNHIEVLFYFDEDDNYLDEYPSLLEKYNQKYPLSIKIEIGPSLILSDYPNKLYKLATSDIFLNLGDDNICITDNWDEILINNINACPNKMNFVYWNDGFWGGKLATHHCLHRNYVECLGYFYPPIFDFGESDRWMTEVAKKSNTSHYIDKILFEHLHYSFNKSEFDSTYQKKEESDKELNNVLLYNRTTYYRELDIKKVINKKNNFG
tara:strand:- start:88 stop:804 length:717 start_codon:yes stop_codon:yes gene_type:complete